MKQALFAGAGAVFGFQTGQRLAELAFTAVLARLLVPADFGLVAAALLFVQFAQLLAELGVGATIVQAPELSEGEVRTAHTIVWANAFLYAGAAALLAPAAAAAMAMPELADVLRVLGLVFLAQAAGIVPESLLLRRMAAARVSAVRFAAKCVGAGAVGVGLALAGWGVWALVAAALAEAATAALVLLAIERPPLRPRFARSEAARLLRRGSGFSLSRLLNYLALRGDNAIVGRGLDAAALGIYSRAFTLMNLPADLYASVAERLIFPALARVQHDRERLRRAYLGGTSLTALVGLPLSALLFLLAPEIVALLLGPRWEAVVAPFAILAGATYCRLGMKISGSAQRAQGAIRQMIRTQGLYAVLVLGGALAALGGGVNGVATAVAVATALAYAVITVACCRSLGVGWIAWARAHREGLALGLVTAGIAAPALWAARTAEWPAVATLALVGAAMTALAAVLVLARPRALLDETALEGVDLLRSRLGLRR